MGAIGDVFLRVRADLKEFEAEVMAVGKKGGENAAQQFGTAFGKAGKSMTNFGRTLTTNVTLPVVGLGLAVSKVGSDFEDTLNQLVGLANVPRESIAGIREELMRLGPELGKTPQELAEGFYFIASAGFEAEEAMMVLETAAKASAAGLGETQDVAKVLGLTLNAYGKENISAARAADVLVAAVTEGTAEASQFAGVLGNVVPTAAQMGVSFDQVTAALAAMTISGVGVEEATTSLNQVLLSLLKPTTQAEAALEGMGTSSAELRQELKEKGLLATLRDLETRFAGNDEAASLVFGNVRALRGALSLLGLDAEQLNDIFAATEAATGNLGMAYEATEGTSREYGRAMAELQVLLIELSEDVLPVAVDLLRQIAAIARTLAGFWRQLSPETRGFVVQLLALAAVVGPTVFIFGKLTSGLGLFLRTLGLAGKVIGPATKLFARLGLTLATTLGESLASSAAVNSIAGGLTSAFNKVPGSGALKGATSKLGQLLGTGLGKAFAVGFAAAAVIGVIETYNQVKQQTQAQNKQISKDVGNTIREGTDEQLKVTKAALETGLKQLDGVWDAGLFTNESRDRLKADLAAVDQALTDGTGRMVQHVAEEIEYGQNEVDVAARQMTSGISAAVVAEGDEAAAEAKKVGGYVATGVGAGILEQQGQVDSAMAALTNLIENERTPAQQASHVIGQLISKEVSNGVVSGRPGVKDAARTLRETGEQELRAFIQGGGKIGKKSMDALRAGMKDKDPEIRNQSRRTLKIIETETDKLKGIGKKGGQDLGDGTKSGIDSKRGSVGHAAGRYKGAIRAQLPSSNEAQRWGQGLGSNYAAGIRSSKKWITQAARNAAAAAAAIFATHSPPGPESPLHHIVDWARTTMQLYAGGIEREGRTVGRAAYGAAEAVSSALSGYVDGPRVGAPSIAAMRAPDVASTILPLISSSGAAAASATAAERGVTYNYNMPVQGALPVRTPRDTIAAMRRISEIGELPPKTLSPQYPRQSSEVRP